MAVTAPPTPPAFPVPTDSPEDFDDKAYDCFPYVQSAANNVYDNAVDAAASATASAGSATNSANSAAASEASANDSAADRLLAQQAAAAAEQAAGLTPDPDFGMVITTTSNATVKTSAFTAVVGIMQDVDTSGGTFGITTPVSPEIGQWFGIRDYNQQAFYGQFPWLIYGSDKIIGLSENCTIDVNTMIFTYRGATKGWCI